MRKVVVRLVRQSPAMIVAMLALFVALTGTAVATTSALITGRQIKNNSITGADVRNRSLTPRDFRGSVRGPRGFRGLTGAAGATGAKGDKGDKGDPGPNLELVVGQEDATPGGTALTASGQVVVNTVNITAPSNGFLVISGHAFVNNDSGTTSYVLNPRLDGTNVTSTGWGSTLFAGADLTAAERFELSYTTAVAVTAGAHTVTQLVGPFTGTSDFFYNNNELIVSFAPNGSITG